MGKFELDFHALLKTLVQLEVEFIVVGGVGAVLQGAPIATFDLDIVHRRTGENVERLLKALAMLNARYRGQAGRRLQPDQSHLLSQGHQLLLTDKGPLDLLGAIGTGRDYDDLMTDSVEMDAGDLTIRVLKLEALIQMKEELNHPKDRAVLAILRETLEQS